MVFKSRKRKILEEHKNLGFPRFPVSEQLEMVARTDYHKIAQLTPYNEWTYELLDHYIFLSVEDLSSHLIASGKLKKHIVHNPPSQDGIWAVQKGFRYNIIDQERGVIYYKEENVTINQVANYFSKVMLSHIPKYEKSPH